MAICHMIFEFVNGPVVLPSNPEPVLPQVASPESKRLRDEERRRDREVRRAKFSAGMKKAATNLVLLDSALKVYQKAGEKQKEAMVDSALRVGVLAALNPEKAKTVKNHIKNKVAGSVGLSDVDKRSIADRMQELKALHQAQLITAEEYEAKKAELLNNL